MCHYFPSNILQSHLGRVCDLNTTESSGFHIAVTLVGCDHLLFVVTFWFFTIHNLSDLPDLNVTLYSLSDFLIIRNLNVTSEGVVVSVQLEVDSMLFTLGLEDCTIGWCSGSKLVLPIFCCGISMGTSRTGCVASKPLWGYLHHLLAGIFFRLVTGLS